MSPWRYDGLDWQHLAQPPGTLAAHWFGTDRLGRDLYVRALHGLRLSLLVSVLASAVSLLIGIAYGALAGFAGGRTDGLMMRAVDVLYSLPYLFIVIILTSLLPRGSLAVLLLALGAVGWLTTARIVRGQTLALKRREFIEAARALGVSPLAILMRHVIPNLLGPVHRVRHPHRAADDPVREFPQLPWPGRAGAAREPRQPDRRSARRR